MRKLLGILLAAILVFGLLTACSAQTPPPQTSTNTPPPEQSPSEQEERPLDVTFDEDNNIYLVFNDFGTKMCLPSVWRGNIDVKTSPDSETCLREFVFSYSSDDGTLKEALGALSVFSENQWSRLANDGSQSSYVELAAIDGNIYAYKIATQTNPFRPGTDDAAIFDSQMILGLEINALLVIEKM